MGQVIKLFFVALSLIALVAIVSVATQSPTWKTGRVLSDPLQLVTGGPAILPPARLWIDTDAACGVTPRTDPDDCLAIVWLASRKFDVVGISTSFGNAEGDAVERTARSLVASLAQNGLPRIPVWKGLAEPRSSDKAVIAPGVTELRAALQRGPLTILALGPLTNLTAALEGRPELHRNVTRVVAVMGHRPGHLFHPTEGKGAGAILGHGPIFRDLNFSMDVDAARRLLALKLPLVLIPYDAAKDTMITGADLDKLSHANAAFRHVAEQSRDWLKFWNTDVGLAGFYPFDWIAAAYLANPRLFDCAHVHARIAREWVFWLLPRDGLLIDGMSLDSDAEPNVLYCPQTAHPLHDVMLSDLAR